MKNTSFRNVGLSFCLVLSCMLHLPVGFGKVAQHIYRPMDVATDAPAANGANAEATNGSLYGLLNLQRIGLSEKAYASAIKGFERLKESGKIHNTRIISIIDFTKPSSSKRLFVIDLEAQKLLFNTFVAHGQYSGNAFATNFSNKPESFQSSLGFYETSGTYVGRNGYSLQLIGLEKGINDKADERAIVMHGAPYVTEHLIRRKGYIGRSWGCPAVPEKLNRPIIDKIKHGTCLFIYADNKTYIKKSGILNS